MTGSMAGVSNYAPLSLISAGGASYNGSAGFQISQDARALTWEKASQFNIGFPHPGRMWVLWRIKDLSWL